MTVCSCLTAAIRAVLAMRGTTTRKETETAKMTTEDKNGVGPMKTTAAEALAEETAATATSKEATVGLPPLVVPASVVLRIRFEFCASRPRRAREANE
jgi:hypothetical protein